MRTSISARYAVSVAVAVLTGCSSAANVAPAQISQASGLGGLAQSQSVSRLARGGSFSASYSGTYYDSGCWKGAGEYTNFTGMGKASFLFRSSESGSVAAPFHYLRGGVCSPWTGAATIMSKRNTQNSITLNLSGGHGPCYPNSKLNWTVSKGTGRFHHATGSGTVTFMCGDKWAYSDQWSGTLYF